MKRYVTIVSGKSNPIIHLAINERMTYCQFEKTTARRLVGYFEQPHGDLCINCLKLSGGMANHARTQQPKRQQPMFEFDTRKLPFRADIDLSNPLPPWD